MYQRNTQEDNAQIQIQHSNAGSTAAEKEAEKPIEVE